MTNSAQVDQFFSAISGGLSSEIESLLQSDPRLLDSRSGSGIGPVMTAIYGEQTDVLDVLRSRGARLDLFDAAALGDIALLHELLAGEPDAVGTYSEDGWTALHLTGHFGRTEAAAMLLDAGADIGAMSHNRNGNTALHAALAGRKAETATFLIRRGANVNTADAAGYTPLHLAAHGGNLDLVRLLLDAGADRRVVRPNGQTPADLASQQRNTEVETVLRG